MDIQELKEGFEDWFVVNYHDGDIHPNHHLLDFKECDQEYVDDLVNMLWEAWQAAKASVAEGFVLVSAEQLSKWGHMANYAEQYGCPECFESRGYAHTLSCEINEYFAIEAQEQNHD